MTLGAFTPGVALDPGTAPAATAAAIPAAGPLAGKAGSLMPAFATSQGGPLNDLQIASLAAYLCILATVVWSHVGLRPTLPSSTRT